jgi:DNA-binding beta-propeller fold protein YncE
MREFVTEQYLPAARSDVAASLAGAARRAAERLISEGTPVHRERRSRGAQMDETVKPGRRTPPLIVPTAVATFVACLALFAAAARATSTSVYVTNAGANGTGGISQYDVVTAFDDALSPKVIPTVAAGDAPFAIAVSPDGKSAYVANVFANGAGGVSEYDVGAGGELTPKALPAVAAGNEPAAIAISPDGKSVYVANRRSHGAAAVSEFDVGAFGELSPKATPAVAGGDEPYGIAVSPDGESVYVTNLNTNGADGVSQYDVGAGGELSLKTVPTVAAGTSPAAIAVSPDGRSVYVTDSGTSKVSQYDVGAGGELSPKPTAMVASGPGPSGIAVSPDGKSVYVTTIALNANGGVSEYDVGVGGQLSPKTIPTAAAGAQPDGIAISPDGKSVYVTNFGTNGAGGVSEYDVGADGELSPKAAPTVAAGNEPTGIVLAPDQGPSASFAVSTAPPGMPSQFDASASGDADGTVVSYIWDFGDGTPLQVGRPAITHSYAKAGTYTARLTVADDIGCSTTFVFTGQTAYCNGGPAATTTRTFTVSVPTSASTPVSVPAPVLSSLRVSPGTFSLIGRRGNGHCLKSTQRNDATKLCRRPIKLTISYTLSASAPVTLTLERELFGRDVNGRCVMRSRANDKHRHCTRLVPVRGRIVSPGSIGHNRSVFSGSIGGHNVGLGKYQLTVTPDGGAPRTTTFTIAP